MLAVVDPRLVLDVLFASSIGFLLFSRVNEQRTLWLLRGWLFLVAMAWFVQRFATLPLTTGHKVVLLQPPRPHRCVDTEGKGSCVR